MVREESSRERKAQKLINDFYENKYNLTKSQLKTAIGFDKENKANDLSTVTRANYLQWIYRLCEEIKNPFKEVTKEQIRDYLNKLNGNLSPNTTKAIKISLRKFFGYVYGTKKGRYPEVVDWIETRSRERHKKVDKKIITEEEYKKLIKGCLTQRDRAIVSFLMNTGARVGELTNTKISDLIFDSKGRYVTIKLGGKTGEREVVMTSGFSEIDSYLKQREDRNNKNEPLFLTLPKSNRPNSKLGWQGVNDMLTELGERAIRRHIYPHLFRHTFATKLASRYTDAEMRIIMGWSKTSQMPGRYSWLRDKNVNKKMLIDAGLEKEDKEIKQEAYKDILCPRCQTPNSFDSVMCRNCFFAFNDKAIEKVAIAEKVMQKGGVVDVTKEAMKEIIKDMIKKGEIKF